MIGRIGGSRTNPAKRAGAYKASLTAAINRVRKHGHEPSAELLVKALQARIEIPQEEV